MLREFLSLFKSDDAVARMGEGFDTMLELTRELIIVAGRHFFDERPSADERTDILRRDVKVNKLERRIRKQVIAHLTLTDRGRQAPYGLLLMSLVKDVERIGDYAKNIVEVVDFSPGPLPDDDCVAELREIRTGVEQVFEATAQVVDDSDLARAGDLIRQGRELVRRADTLVTRIARSNYDASTASGLVLGTRYYKRIGAHVLNVLSSVVMPLHKIDYYDEDAPTFGKPD